MRRLTSRCVRTLWWFGFVLAASIVPVAHAQILDSLVMPGAVSEAHVQQEKDCKACHTPFKKNDQSRLCLACHKAVAQDVTSQRGFHGLSPAAQGKDCKNCHTEHKGREAKIVVFDEKTFNHNHTDYPLKGAHGQTNCKSCHKAAAKFRDAPSSCTACHRKDDKHKGGLGEKCENCHSEKNWKDAKFDHSKTRFALAGKHADAICESCHKDGLYKDTPRTCVACHRKEDAHKGRYGEKCDTCHHAESWKPQFNHARQARYALLGKHAAAKCDACHRGPVYQEKLNTRCVSCHQKDDAHKGSLGDKCETCHKENGWTNTSFDHNRDTRFPLYNKHKVAACDSCHKNGVKEKIASGCIDCHRKDDSHQGAFGKSCQTCHGDGAWKPATFDHAKTARYALRDAHAAAKCSACHTGALYVADGGKKLATDCFSCHRKDDAHKGQLGQQCESCHSERKWQGILYDHNQSRFKLAGKHARTACKSCHKTAAFKDAPMLCVQCHEGDDVHKRTLGSKCETCHSTRSWQAWDFDHNRQTNFSLAGAHGKAKCSSCHQKAAANAAAPMPLPAKACFGCHASDDVHSGGFGQACERCHLPTEWRAVKPDMARGTRAPAN
jgi:predicted CXXCH cytochrome family protein